MAIAQILEASKGEATKTVLMHDLPLTYRRMRRIIAELVDRGFLRFIISHEVYITTHKGNICLDKLKTDIYNIMIEVLLVRKLENNEIILIQLF
jgi:predicted transcriptional regulator